MRLAELLATLSLATDLGTAFPLEKALRNALLAVSLGRELGLSADELSDAYFMAMLRFLGCSAFAPELAAAFGGDDNIFHSTFEPIDPTSPRQIVSQTMRYLARDAPPLKRVESVVRMLTSGQHIVDQMRTADCEAADGLARRLGLSAGVRQGLAHVWTRWDGRGQPRIAGEHIALAARLSQLANLVEIFVRVGGPDAAQAMLRERRGADLDPTLVDVFVQRAEPLLACLDVASVWDAALSAEPLPQQHITAGRLDSIAQAFGHFADLKSPFTLGHSSSVSKLAEAAARELRLSEVDAVACRQAGWLHDLGRVSVPSGIWDKPARLSPAEWERVRLHAYYSERVLAQSPALQPLAALAGMHHERRDGSGYHRASLAAAQPVAARLLASADAYAAMLEERPHRPALAPAAAAQQLEAEAIAGHLDREAVDAVLKAAGHARPARRAAWPAGLSDREVEVLRLVARGKSDKDIGRALVISDITVHHHVRHIYTKIDVSSRAGAALFAMEHDLLAPE